MLWVYVVVGTAGLVMAIPAVLQTVDGLASNAISGALGFAATVFGASGLVLQQFDMGTATTFAASLALGMAAGAVQPEVFKSLGEQHRNPAEAIAGAEAAD